MNIYHVTWSYGDYDQNAVVIAEDEQKGLKLLSLSPGASDISFRLLGVSELSDSELVCKEV